MRLSPAVLVAALLLPGSARAGEVSPRLRSPFFSSARGAEPVRVAAELTEHPTPATLARLVRAGARAVELPMGGWATAGRWVSLDVPRARLDAVAAAPGVVRLEPGRLLWRAAPLDRTARMAGAAQQWASRPPLDPQVDGSGVVIADHEMAWDPLHPDLFLPDAGLFDWIDRSGDGELGEGDAVVLDGAERRLRILTPTIDDPFGAAPISGPRYDPGLDWLYVDENGNGRRDAGARYAGRPALGEPIFSGDDVDQDGRVELGERMARLGSAKVVGIFDEGTLFGPDALWRYAPNTDPSHGVSVSSILAGGWPGLRRFTGMAPNARLAFVRSSDPIQSIAAARRFGAQVELWEMSSLVEFHDGSSALEEAISDDARSGVAHLTATGNIGGSGHTMAIRPLRAPTTERLLTAPAGVTPPGVVVVMLTWLGAQADVDVALAISGFPGVDLTLEPNQHISLSGPDALDVDVVREVSARGTAGIFLALTRPDGGTLSDQSLEISLTPRRTITEVRGLVVDDASGWGRGAQWAARLTESGTALVPSTADVSIAVGAYGGIHDLSALGFGRPGEVRPYSGTGPRLDGERVVDVVAPDDPYAAAPDANYGAFSGTSGALPHAAGTAALLTSAGITGAARIEEILTRTARADAFTGATPNPRAGAGKLDAVAALGFGRLDASDLPALTTAVAYSAGVARLRAQATSRSARVVRLDVDFDYDLRYDQAYEGAALEATLRAPEGARVVIRVVDDAGQVLRRLVPLTATTCLPTECQRPDGTCGACGADAGVDAGFDGGVAQPRTDAGAPDLGVGAPDASAPRDAAGTARAPGLELLPEGSAGCGCRTGGADGADGAALVVALSILAARRRRRP